MKNTIILFVLLVGLQFMNAQDFQETTKYSITSDIKTKQQEYDPYTVNLVKSDNASERLAIFTIDEISLFEDVFISTIENPGLDGVSEIIKVEIEYLACCAYVESYYIIAMEDSSFISLPKLENVFCETADTIFQYTFPNQEHGIEGTIVKSEVLYNESAEIKSINLIQSFTWIDDDFDPTNSIAITGF